MKTKPELSMEINRPRHLGNLPQKDFLYLPGKRAFCFASLLPGKMENSALLLEYLMGLWGPNPPPFQQLTFLQNWPAPSLLRAFCSVGAEEVTASLFLVSI